MSTSRGSYSINRTPTHVFTRELDRLVHQGAIDSYYMRKGTGKRRFVVFWPGGERVEYGVAALDGVLEAVARDRGEVAS